MPQVNEHTIDGHAKMMLQLGTWATQVEVAAAATYFQMPVYYIALEQDAAIRYKWSVVKPLCSRNSLCFPDEDETVVLRKPITHFELIYYSHVHFDCVVSLHSNALPNSVPDIATQHIYADSDVL